MAEYEAKIKYRLLLEEPRLYGDEQEVENRSGDLDMIQLFPWCREA